MLSISNKVKTRVLIFLFSLGVEGLAAFSDQPVEKKPISLEDLIRQAKASSPDLQLSRLEAFAKSSEARSNYGALIPELGVEGGARSSREREKRNDLFYYAYGRYEISAAEIFDLKASLSRGEVWDLRKNQVTAHLEGSVAIIFFKCLLLQEKLRFMKEDLDLTEVQIRNAERRVSGGLATSTDLLEFQLHQQEMKNDMLPLEQELQNELRDLERLVGTEEKITALNANFFSPKIDLNFDVIWKAIETANIEIRQARADVGAHRAESRALLAKRFPRFSAEAQFGKLEETDFRESKKNSWSVVGKLTMPVFSGSLIDQRSEAKSYEAERAVVNEKETISKIRNLTIGTIELAKRLEKKLDGEISNMETARRYYQSVSSEYKRGVKNSPDMAGATDKLFEAKFRIIETKRDLSLAYFRLLLLQGKTIESFGIEYKP